MGRKGVKLSNEQKLKYAQLCFEEKMSQSEAAQLLNVNKSTIQSWVYRYREQGPLGFHDTGKNNIYSPELKLNAVKSYLNGDGSQRKIAAKFGLRNTFQLRTWLKMYNNGENFLRKMSGGSRMNTSRPTTKDIYKDAYLYDETGETEVVDFIEWEGSHQTWDFPVEKGAKYYIKIELKKHAKGDKIHPIVFPNN